MINSTKPPTRPADKSSKDDDSPFTPKADIWFSPGFDPSDLEGAQHVVMDGAPDPLNPFAEPELETVIATEDDFEDDCPLCEMMRDRVRSGEQIEITKVKWE